ncbi:Cation/H+ exchanger [Dillenia turbinata]|uniref:Cation/H+ exchanger n=1 Tax=Dillenia turbinata TaxID=194707 RepID=A0AAN8ZB54_9MAGN
MHIENLLFHYVNHAAETGGNFTLEQEIVCHDAKKIDSHGIFSTDDLLNYTVPLLLAQFILIFFITRVAYFLLKPLRQSLMSAQIIGGIIMGPSCLGRDHGYSRMLTPPESRLVLETFASFGFMLHLFLVGIQMDIRLLKKTRRNAMVMGIASFLVPYVIGTLVCIFLSKTTKFDDPAVPGLLPYIAAANSVTSFPVITNLLKDLKILNSELGRFAASTAVICDLCSFFLALLMTTMSLAEKKSTTNAVMSLACTIVIPFTTMVLVIEPLILHMRKKIKHHNGVMKEPDFGVIMIIVLLFSLFTEWFGQHSGLGALVVGFAIPDGPPLGSALVDKMDTMATGLLMPVYYTISGMRVNYWDLHGHHTAAIIAVVITAGYIAKFFGTYFAARYYGIQFNDAVALSLIMCGKGVIDVATYTIWKEGKISLVMNEQIIDGRSYTLLFFSMLVFTGISRPVILYLYDPSQRYTALGRRGGLAHNKRRQELRILVCVHEEENVPSFINLLELCNPTRRIPISIFVVHLVELQGHATSVLLPFDNDNPSASQANHVQHIVRSFIYFEQCGEGRRMDYFTSIAPFATMHNDICTLAFDKEVSLVVVPFHKKWTIDGSIGAVFSNQRTVNHNVINKAPCSVGILVNRYQSSALEPMYRIGLIFLGGMDDREALALAMRMSTYPRARVIVTWIKSWSHTYRDKDEAEAYLDEELIEDFKERATEELRMVYKESIANDGVETTRIVRSMDDSVDLMIVGKHHDRSNPVMLGLTEWSQSSELGIIGDMLATSDFRFSVLVIQQEPPIRGVSMGGIIMGPSFLGRNPEYSRKLFPPSSTMVLETWAYFGFMLHLFSVGIQMDVSLLKKAGRDAIAIGIASFLLPYAIQLLVFMVLIASAVKMEPGVVSKLRLVVIANNITSFPVVVNLLKDLNILNSELGRFATSAAMISDLCSSSAALLLSLGGKSVSGAAMSLFWFSAFISILVFVVRPLLLYASKKMKKGVNGMMKQAEFLLTMIILCLVSLCGLLVGHSMILGPFAMGIVIPGGSTLGLALIKKLDTMVTGVFMPVFYTVSGIRANYFDIREKNSFVFAIVIVAGYIAKFSGTYSVALYWGVRFKDAVALSLIMCSKGVVDICIYTLWKDNGILDDRAYALLIFTMVLSMVISSPAIKYLYDPSERYTAYAGRRAIAHCKKKQELRMLVCINKEENVPALVNLLELFNPTRRIPITIFAIHLIELAGRATSVLLQFDPEKTLASQPNHAERIVRSFINFKQRGEGRRTEYFTSIAPYGSMHNDVCTLALDKEASLVIVPFHKQWTIDGSVGAVSSNERTVNRNILEKAPCSVGVLVDRSLLGARPPVCRVGLIFLGGADDREALALVMRLSSHANATVVVTWIKQWDCMSEDMDDRGRNLDEESIEEFKGGAVENERMVYKEATANDGVETKRILHSMEDSIDLMMVGKHHHRSGPVIRGLTERSEYPELGTIGDLLATSDFRFSVLVIQQQP